MSFGLVVRQQVSESLPAEAASNPAVRRDHIALPARQSLDAWVAPPVATVKDAAVNMGAHISVHMSSPDQ